MRIIEDVGAVIAARKPVRLPQYRRADLPDPAACCGALAIENENDGNPRARLVVSNGASWDCVAWLGDVSREAARQTIDVTPLVRHAVAEMLPALVSAPALVPAPAQAALPAPRPTAQDATSADMKAVAQAVLEMAEQINALQARVRDLEATCDYLANHALARVEVKR